VLVFAIVVSMVGVASGAAVPFTTVSVATGTANQYDPRIDGKIITWTSWSPLVVGSTMQVGIRDLDAASTFYIGTTGDDGAQHAADVSSERIAYQSDAAGTEDIRINDLMLVADYTVTNAGGDEVEPAIDGNLVVWRNDVDDTLWYRNLSRGVTAQVPSSAGASVHDVDNGLIGWVEGRQVYTFRPGMTGVTIPTNEYTVADPLTIDSIQMHGDFIAVTVTDTDEDARVIDIRKTGATDVNPDSVYNESNPSVFHKGASWQTDQGGNEHVFFKVLGDSVTNVAGTADDEMVPSLYGRRLVYQRDVGTINHDIWMGTGTKEIARTSGGNRYATAAAVSAAYFSRSAYVVLCTGENFPDALSAASYARAINAPLLLVRRYSMPPETATEISRLQVENMIVIGSDAAVATSMLNNFTDMIGWSRIQGANRYETSAAVARAVAAQYTGVFAPNKAFFARGDNFPDALAVGPVAAGANAPILLVPSTSVPAAISDVVDDLNLTSGVIVGSSDAVSGGVQDALTTLLQANGGDEHPIERWSGSDRYATAVSVIEHALEARWIDLDTLGVATGANFPDALGGGAAMACYGSPILLTPATSVPASVNTFLTAHEYDVGRMDVFGGTTVVSDSVKNSIASKLK